MKDSGVAASNMLVWRSASPRTGLPPRLRPAAKTILSDDRDFFRALLAGPVNPALGIAFGFGVESASVASIWRSLVVAARACRDWRSSAGTTYG